MQISVIWQWDHLQRRCQIKRE